MRVLAIFAVATVVTLTGCGDDKESASTTSLRPSTESSTSTTTTTASSTTASSTTTSTTTTTTIPTKMSCAKADKLCEDLFIGGWCKIDLDVPTCHGVNTPCDCDPNGPTPTEGPTTTTKAPVTTTTKAPVTTTTKGPVTTTTQVPTEGPVRADCTKETFDQDLCFQKKNDKPCGWLNTYEQCYYIVDPTTTEAPVSSTTTEAPVSSTTTEAPVSSTTTEAPVSSTTTEAPETTTTEAPISKPDGKYCGSMKIPMAGTFDGHVIAHDDMVDMLVYQKDTVMADLKNVGYEIDTDATTILIDWTNEDVKALLKAFGKEGEGDDLLKASFNAGDDTMTVQINVPLFGWTTMEVSKDQC